MGDKEYIICAQCGKREDFMWVDKYCLYCFDVIVGFKDTYIELRVRLTDLCNAVTDMPIRPTHEQYRSLNQKVAEAKEVLRKA